MEKKESYAAHGVVVWMGAIAIAVLSLGLLGWVAYGTVLEWDALEPLSVTGIAFGAASLRLAFTLLRRWNRLSGLALNVAAGIVPIVGVVLSLGAADLKAPAVVPYTQASAVVAAITLVLTVLALILDAVGQVKSVWRWRPITWSASGQGDEDTPKDGTVAQGGASHVGTAAVGGDTAGDGDGDVSGSYVTSVREVDDEKGGTGTYGLDGHPSEVSDQNSADTGANESIERAPLKGVAIPSKHGLEQLEGTNPEVHGADGVPAG